MPSSASASQVAGSSAHASSTAATLRSPCSQGVRSGRKTSSRWRGDRARPTERARPPPPPPPPPPWRSPGAVHAAARWGRSSTSPRATAAGSRPTSTPRTPSRTRSPPRSWRSCARTPRPSSSSRTCTGRTRRRSTSSGSSGAGSRRCPRSSSPPTATTSSTARTRCGSCSASWGRARSVGRLDVAPLSQRAVADLAAPHGLDAGELYLRTGGNPFFVTEVLASGEEHIPATVRDAVLARAARLGSGARTVLDAVAIAPPQVELWLLDALADDAAAHLEECLGSGMLVAGDASVAFRHELARLAVQESLPPTRRVALHREALRALSAPPDSIFDLARLAHHAEEAGDAEAVLRFAPAAAGARDDGRRPSRSGGAGGPGAALRRRPPAGAAGAPARTALVRVLPDRPVRRGDRSAGPRGRALPGDRRPAEGSRRPLLALAPGLVRGGPRAGRVDGPRGGLHPRALPAQP